MHVSSYLGSELVPGGSDNSGGFLMQVFDLGAEGKDFKKVAEVTDFIKQAERAAGLSPTYKMSKTPQSKCNFITMFLLHTAYGCMKADYCYPILTGSLGKRVNGRRV